MVSITIDSKKFEKDLTEGLDQKLDEIADQIFAESQLNIARNSTDTAELLRSGSVKRSFLKKTISYDAPQADFIEFGTHPHMPPVEPLERWAIRKGFGKGKGWAIAKKIERDGTDPKPFMRPAVDSVINRQRL